MDWKQYYHREITAVSGRKTVDGLLDTAEEDGLAKLLAGGAVVSFPHTALCYAGPLQARVVAALYRSGVERVIALGVLHSGVVDAYRIALDRKASIEHRRAALDAVSGGLLLTGESIETPFGDLPVEPTVLCEQVPMRVDTAGVLADEFSLDTFFALMRRAADRSGVSPIPVLPVFIGPTRDPIVGSFDVADRLGDWLRSSALEPGRNSGTAVVVTGDLVHYGTGYGLPDADPMEAGDEIERRFRGELNRTLSAALTDGDRHLAYCLSNDVLRNDQREILAVLSAALGRATHCIAHFELSDYSHILDLPPPCLVASSLVVLESEQAHSAAR